MFNFTVVSASANKASLVIRVLECALPESNFSAGNHGYDRDDLYDLIDALRVAGIVNGCKIERGNASVPGHYTVTVGNKTTPARWRQLNESVKRAKEKKSFRTGGTDWAQYVVNGTRSEAVNRYLDYDNSKTHVVREHHITWVTDGQYKHELRKGDAFSEMVGISHHASGGNFTVLHNRKMFNWLGQELVWNIDESNYTPVA